MVVCIFTYVRMVACIFIYIYIHIYVYIYIYIYTYKYTYLHKIYTDRSKKDLLNFDSENPPKRSDAEEAKYVYICTFIFIFVCIFMFIIIQVFTCSIFIFLYI
jgi:hypothetical protein